MSVYTVIALAALGVIIYDFLTNLVRLYGESKKLKAAGKTPLTGRNTVVVLLAFAIEIVVVFLVTLLFAKMKISASYLHVFLMFIATYLIKNIGAYMTAWGMWATFVKVDQKAAIKKVKEEKKKAL